MTRSRPEMDRALIVDAALEIIDTDGVEGLSMRRLARRLGSAPMSLYRYVASKDELMGLVVAALAGRMPAGDLARPWREVLTEIFTSVRRLLQDHPGIVVYLSDETILAPATLRTAESALDALHRAGLDDVQAALAFSTLWTFTVGSVLVDQSLSAPSRDPAATEQRRREMSQAVGAAALDAYPRLAASAQHWAGADSEAVFDAGLAMVLDAVYARAAAR